MIEGLITQDAILHLGRALSLEDAERIRIALARLEGIESIQTEGEVVSLVFYPEIFSLSLICEQLKRLGYEPIQEKKERNPFRRLMGNLAESNRKNFGSERLDCCTINRKFRRH